MSDLDLDELRSELEEFAQPEKRGGRSPQEERVIAGFEDIQRFVQTHGRVPQHGEEGDKLYHHRNGDPSLLRCTDAVQCDAVMFGVIDSAHPP